MPKPNLVLISQTIRRDLHHPLVYFQKFNCFHLYEQASYGDMTSADFISPPAIQFKGLVDLYRKIKSLNPDILQAAEPAANSTSFKISLVVLVYWFFHRPKVIVPFFENVPFKNKFGRIKLGLVIVLTRQLGKIASLLIVLNDGAKKNLLNIDLPKTKIESLMWGSWGLDTNEFRPLKNKQDKTILFLGRVTQAKGIPMLVEAFKTVLKDVPSAQLMIAGPKGDASRFLNGKNIQYLGSIKNKDVAQLLSSATVVVMPSQTTSAWVEQVGMVGLQALSCGTPVITTDSGAIPEYFKPDLGSQIIPEKDERALIEALTKILSNDKYRRAQEGLARQYILDNFEVRDKISEIEVALKIIKPNLGS